MPKYYPGGGKLVKCGGNNGTTTTGAACPAEMPDKYEAVCDPDINTEKCPYDRGMTPQGKKCNCQARILRATPSVLSSEKKKTNISPFLLTEGANSGFTLSITPLRYF